MSKTANFEYAVEITDCEGEFLRQVDVVNEYDVAAQMANAANHDKDVLGDDQFVRVVRIDYNNEGEEIGKETVREFDRDEPDANELFNDVLNALNFQLEPYTDEDGKNGYRLFDTALGKYRSFEGEDVIVSSAMQAIEELDTYVYDGFYTDLAEELETYGLVKDGEKLTESLDELYVHIALLANEEQDGAGAKFWENHKEELAMVNLICNRIEDVDLSVACPQTTSEQIKNKVKETLEKE